MDDKNSVPYVVFESSQARMERTIKRLWILAIILIVLLFATNAAWIHYENQFVDEVTETYSSEADDGGLAIVNRDGSVNYGQSNVHPEDDAKP